MKLLTLLLVLCAAQLNAQSMCDCGTNYTVYRSQVDGEDSYHFDVNGLLKFLAAFGQPSPFIYDFNGDGVVNTPDLLQVLGGFGSAYPFDYCGIEVMFVASSGWPATYPGAYFAVVKPTVFDEEGGTFQSCPLKSWWVELTYIDPNSTVRLWFH